MVVQGGCTKVIQRSTHARPCMHMQQCSAVLAHSSMWLTGRVHPGQWVTGSNWASLFPVLLWLFAHTACSASLDLVLLIVVTVFILLIRDGLITVLSVCRPIADAGTPSPLDFVDCAPTAIDVCVVPLSKMLRV